MKKDKKNNIKNMDLEGLRARLSQINLELIGLNMDLKIGKLKNTQKLAELRNERAVIKTVISEKVKNNIK